MNSTIDLNTTGDYTIDWMDPKWGLRTTYGVRGTLAGVITEFGEKGTVYAVYNSTGMVWKPRLTSRMG